MPGGEFYIGGDRFDMPGGEFYIGGDQFYMAGGEFYNGGDQFYMPGNAANGLFFNALKVFYSWLSLSLP